MTGTPAAFDVHEFTAQQDFVRRLCRSLVFDQDRVDDAVQDAWVAALRRPPRDAAAARTWFGRVVHNLARRRHRDEVRRHARERTAAQAERLPSAAEVLEREQLRRRVVDAVMALAEPYRGTVLARFFEDLPPAEIARRRSVPAATVRSQLHRGLELLREHFDRQHGGDRRAWCLSLLPLLRPAAGTGMATVSTTAGVLLMTKLLAAAGALVLGVFGLLWTSAGGTPPPIASVAAADLGSGDATATDRETAPAPPAARPARTAPRVQIAATTDAPPAEPAAVAAAGLRGRVVDPQHRPVQGALVRVLGIDGRGLFTDAGHEHGAGLPHAAARTGDDGVFTVDGIWPEIPYAVHADYDGPNRTLVELELTPQPGAVHDIGDIVLVPKGAIAGRAVDEAGAPIAGAEVLAFDLPAALTAVMPFELFDPREGLMMVLPVPEAGTSDAAQRDRLRAFLGRDLFLRTDLDRDQALTTLVVDGPQWARDLWDMLPIARGVTGDDGAFVLQGVEPGSNMLVVRRPGLQAGVRPRVRIAAGERVEVGEVELGLGERLTGAVHTDDGAPVAGAEVRVGAIGALGYRGAAFALRPIRTGTDGRFALDGLSRGRVLVAVRRDAAMPWHVIGPVDAADDVDVALPAVAALELQLERADGEPVRGADVELFAGPPMHEMRRLGLQQQLPVDDRLERRDDATLVLRDLPPGCYTVRVRAAAAVPLERFVVLPTEAPLALRLEPQAPLLVRVTDHRGQPVAGARVFVHRTDPAPAELTVLPTDYGLERWRLVPLDAGVTDGNGELRVRGRPSAAVTVVATHPLQPPASVEIDAAAVRADVQLPEAGALHGRLFDHGRPADPAGWAIVAEPEPLGAMPRRTVRATIGPDGAFALPNLAPAQYRVHAEERGGAQRLQNGIDKVEQRRWWFGGSRHEQDVVIAPGAEATLAFDVDRNQPPPETAGARIVGSAVLDGRPLAGAELVRRVDWMTRSTLATVAGDGSFVVPTVVAGDRDLELRLGDDTLWRGSVNLPVGGEIRLDLRWSTGGLRGDIDAAGLPLEELEVTAAARLDGGTVERSAAVAADGTFALSLLPAGTYTIACHGPAARSEPATVQVDAGGSAGPVRLRLHEVPALIGRVEANGQDLIGTLLMLTSEGRMYGAGLLEDGAFAFGNLQPTTYTAVLRRGEQELPIEPSTFDLGDGRARRDLVIRVLGSSDGGR